MKPSLTLLAYVFCLLLSGCGYGFGQADQSVLDPKYRTLAISGVDNPTTLTWLEPRLRKLLRDELTNRATITWADSQDDADALIQIRVIKYYRPTAVEGSSDETLRSNAIFNLEGVIRSTTDNAVLWRSGQINQTWPFFTGQETEADKEVTRLAIRRLADRMSQNY